LSPGAAAKTFDFQTEDAKTVRIGTMICYENLYPEMSADLVRNGAQVLTSFTNNGETDVLLAKLNPTTDSDGTYLLGDLVRAENIRSRRQKQEI
jgi:predicted amidohydrolase